MCQFFIEIGAKPGYIEHSKPLRLPIFYPLQPTIRQAVRQDRVAH